jgi:ribosome-associated protein
MEGIASAEAARAIAGAIADHKGGDVVMLDVASLAGWTDRFVIATASSSVHLRGLERVALEEASRLGMERLYKGSSADDDEWLLVDLGNVVVHLMTERARSFYVLEKLWFQASCERVSAAGPGLAPAPRP